MKTTLDIPDALYRRFKMKTAMNGETVRNATLSFITSYVNGRAVGLDSNGIPSEPSKKSEASDLPAWAGLAAPYIRKNRYCRKVGDDGSLNFATIPIIKESDRLDA